MNLCELQRKLTDAARANAPDDRVPYAFEKRILALISSRPQMDQLALWVRGLWRAAASCVAIALLLGAWAFFTNPTPASNSSNLSQNFETTLLASVDQSASTP